MFSTISWVSLGLVLAGSVMHWGVLPSPRLVKREAVGAGGDRPWSGCCGGKLSTLACAVALGSLVILFVTGFGGRLLLGEQIHGYTLMMHVGLAPVFVISAGVVVIAWSHRCRLNEYDRRGLVSLLCLKKTAPADTVDLGWKLTFWMDGVDPRGAGQPLDDAGHVPDLRHPRTGVAYQPAPIHQPCADTGGHDPCTPPHPSRAQIGELGSDRFL